MQENNLSMCQQKSGIDVLVSMDSFQKMNVNIEENHSHQSVFVSPDIEYIPVLPNIIYRIVGGFDILK